MPPGNTSQIYANVKTNIYTQQASKNPNKATPASRSERSLTPNLNRSNNLSTPLSSDSYMPARTSHNTRSSSYYNNPMTSTLPSAPKTVKQVWQAAAKSTRGKQVKQQWRQVVAANPYSSSSVYNQRNHMLPQPIMNNALGANYTYPSYNPYLNPLNTNSALANPPVNHATVNPNPAAPIQNSAITNSKQTNNSPVLPTPIISPALTNPLAAAPAYNPAAISNNPALMPAVNIASASTYNPLNAAVNNLGGSYNFIYYVHMGTNVDPQDNKTAHSYSLGLNEAVNLTHVLKKEGKDAEAQQITNKIKELQVQNSTVNSFPSATITYHSKTLSPSKFDALINKHQSVFMNTNNVGIFDPSATSASLPASPYNPNIPATPNYTNPYPIANPVNPLITSPVSPQQVTSAPTQPQLPSAGQFDHKQAEKLARRYKTTKAGLISFLKKVKQVAKNLGVSKEELLTTMLFETGSTLGTSMQGPYVRNRGRAQGLIQFMPATFRGLMRKHGKGKLKHLQGKTLAQMTRVEQMDLVEVYLKQAGVKPGHKAGHIHAAIFTGHAKNAGKNLSDGYHTQGRALSRMNREHRPYAKELADLASALS